MDAVAVLAPGQADSVPATPVRRSGRARVTSAIKWAFLILVAL
jgi:hypothetical protein